MEGKDPMEPSEKQESLSPSLEGRGEKTLPAGRPIALFLPSLRGGGAERAMADLARCFSGRGHAVDVVLPRAEGPCLAMLPREVRVVDLAASRTLAALPGLVRYIRRERPAALLSTPEHGNIIAIAARFLAGGGPRLAVRAANTLSADSRSAPSLRGRVLLPLAVRLLYRFADSVVAVSESVAGDLAKSAGIPPERIRVIYNPVVGPELFLQAGAPPLHPWLSGGGPPVVLAAGRLAPQKDYPTLLRAFRIVRGRRSARLLVLGEGPDRPLLEGMAGELGLSGDADFPGFAANPFPCMKRAALFVQSSAWEGLPNALIQAMALGTPVVGTDCPGGTSEILRGGALGRLVPPGDPEALEEAVCDGLDEKIPPCPLCGVEDRFGEDEIAKSYLEELGVPSPSVPEARIHTSR